MGRSGKRGRAKGGGERNVRLKGSKGEEAPVDPDPASGKGCACGREDPKQEEAPVDPNPGREYAPQLPEAANPKPASGKGGLLGRKVPKEAEALVHPNPDREYGPKLQEVANTKPASEKGTSGRKQLCSSSPAETGFPLTMEDNKGKMHMVMPKKDREIEAFEGYHHRKKDKRTLVASKSNVASDSSPIGSNASNYLSQGSSSDGSANRTTKAMESGDRTYSKVATEAVLRERAAAEAKGKATADADYRPHKGAKRAPLNSAKKAVSESSVSETSASSISASGSASSTASSQKSYSRIATDAILQERAAAEAKRAAADAIVRQSVVADAIARQHAASSIPSNGTVPESSSKKKKTVPEWFLEFLESFVKQGDSAPYYPAFVDFMKARESFELEVSFQRLLTFSVELGMLIANNTRSEYLLLPTVKKFLVKCEHALGYAGQKVSLSFFGKPHNITPLKRFFDQGWNALVKEFKDIFHEGHYATTLSDLTIALYGGYLEEIFNTWALNLSWGGDFNLDDLVVVNNNQFIITKKPKMQMGGDKAARIRAKRADVKRIEELFTPQLDGSTLVERQGQPFEDSDLPLFYPDLRDALRGSTETNNDVDEKWFPDFILHNPGLKTPDARYDFVCDSCTILRQPSPEIAAEILTKFPLPLCDFRGCSNWQADIATSGIKVLTDVYYHRNAKAKEAGESHISTGAGSTGAPAHDRFVWEIGGIMKYDRNLLQHAYKTIKMSSLAEVEVFASKKLLPYLPYFLKLMLENDLMKGIFLGTWKEYKSSRIRTTDGLHPNPGPRLQFWDTNLGLEHFPEMQG